MTRGTALRTIEAALLATLLLAPPAALAQGRSSPSPGDPGGWLSAVRTFLTALLPGGATPDTRCTIDPDGRTSCAGSGAALDNRCTIDPNGGTSCAGSGAAADTRCGIDPDGRFSCGPGF